MATKNKILTTIRLTKKEIDKLNERSSTLKISKSELIRRLINENPIKVVEMDCEKLRKAIDKIPTVINTMGNNLNQIAKKLNSGKEYNKDYDRHITIHSEQLSQLIGLLQERKTTTFKEI